MTAAIRSDPVPHLAPALVLLHKAHLCRPKDDHDLAVALPTLSSETRRWLAEAVRLAVPESPWLPGLLDD